MRKLLFLLTLLPVIASAMDKIAEVEHSSTSVILRFPLYDAAAPEQCASDVTISTSGLQINVSTDVTDGYYDQFQQSDSTLEAITTIGTYATPTATKARFEIIATGACTYELQLPDAAFAVSNATILTIAITDGGTEIIDSVYYADLTPVSQSTLVDTLLDTSCSGYATAGDVGYQLCTVNDAILTDTGTTLDSRQQTINNNTNYNVITTETADSGSTTTLVDADNLSGLGNDKFNRGASLYVDLATGVEGRCVSDYDSATSTVTVNPAFSAAVSTQTYTLVADPGCAAFDVVVEGQGDTYTAAEVLSLLLAEGLGTCTYDSTVRTWTCNDPGGNQQRFVITYGSGLDGTRTSSSTSPSQ